MSKIVVRGVERDFDRGGSLVHALGPMDLQVGSGEFVCVVGPSGCGKSTLLRVLAGLIDPSRGEAAITAERQGVPLVSVVFQDYSIFPWKTVAANVRFGLDVAKVPRTEADSRVDGWLERLGLIDFRDAYPATLSGGMRQRVSIARALVVEPEILLMDEPFAALDAQLRHVMQDELLELCQEDRRTVVLVTHSLDEAILLGDRVIVMSARPGRTVGEFPIPFARPRIATEIRGSATFAQLESDIWELLRREVGERVRAPAASPRELQEQADGVR